MRKQVQFWPLYPIDFPTHIFDTTFMQTVLQLGAVYMEVGRSQHQEDPRRRNNFLFGLHAKISVQVEVENESKMAGENNKHVIWVLLLSLLALITSFQQQLVVLHNLIFKLQQQQTIFMHLTHSAAVARHFHLLRTRRSTCGLGE